jgi:sirohydrochlorin ferrochelatase
MNAIADAVRARGHRAAVGHLDLAEPDVPTAFGALVDGGAERVVAVPMLLTPAFHARVDVPAALERARAARPAVELRSAEPLGPDPLLEAALARRWREALDPAVAQKRAVVVLAAGSADPNAREVVVRIAQRFTVENDAPASPAFASGEGPTPTEAMREARLDGRGVAVLLPYLLAPGVLPDRGVAEARAAAAELGTRLFVAEPLGAAPEVIDLVIARASAALS